MIHSKFLIHWTGKDINEYNREMTDNLRKRYVDRLNDDLQKGLCMKPGEEMIYGRNNKWIKSEIARVCFTEIKLTQIEKHAKRYGGLGIGFNRDFVLEREGNPVFYVQNGDKGHIVENFDILRGWIDSLSYDIVGENMKVFEIILGYLKNMSCRNENELKYYDEMEWRIVHIDRLMGKYLSKKDEKKGVYRVDFKPGDVQLIIFPDNETIRLAFQNKEISGYFNSYIPTLIALDDCKNF